MDCERLDALTHVLALGVARCREQGPPMDRDRFDALAKLLATTGSRRAALGALLGAALLGHDPDALAKPRRGKGQRKHRGADRGEQQRGGLAAEGRGQHHRRGKKHRRQDQDGGEPSEPAVESACGTKHCAPPGPGSIRSGCDFNGFNGHAFAGQDLQRTIFRGIDGRGTNFNDTDNRGSIFAEACLRSASFRGAQLAGAIWRDACLVDADFTGADLGGAAHALTTALLCRTILPDGTRNDRDCGRDTALCRSSIGGGGGGPGPCTGPGDCPDVPCRTKVCTNRACVYTSVANGPSPNGLCDGHCCRGACCPPGIPSCNPSGQCCAPNCAGKVCGPDGCGTGGTCGTCTTGQVCQNSTRCVCDRQTGCPGCCAADASCQPGNTNQVCGMQGNPCRPCPANTACRNGRCACTSTQACTTGQECVDGACVCTPRSCPVGCCDANGACLAGNGEQACGTGGRSCAACLADQRCLGGRCTCTAATCANGQACVNGRCVCTAQSCPDGCCAADGTCRPSTNATCGTKGAACANCTAVQTCTQGACVCDAAKCAAQSEDPRCCAADGTCQDGDHNSHCGRNGDPCRFCPFCLNGRCDCGHRGNGCENGCCIDASGPFSSFCLPGTSDQACGAGANTCLTCPADQRCVDQRCVCTAQSCPAGQACVDGRCVCNAQSCPNGCCANGPGNPGECRPGNRIDACGKGGVRCASCSERQTCQGGQCVGCNGHCTCAGQSVCTSAGAPHVVCGGQGGGACVCVNSRTGQPFCLGFEAKDHVCETDADCQSVFPGGVCVDHTTRPGIAEFCFNSHPYCVGPCP